MPIFFVLVISFPECGLTRCLVHDVWSVLAITASVMFSSPREIKQTTLLQLVRIFCQKCRDFEIFVTQLWVSCVACNAAADAENALFINLRERERVSKLSLINFRLVELLNMPWDLLTVLSSALIKHLQLIIYTHDIKNNNMKSIENVN